MLVSDKRKGARRQHVSIEPISPRSGCRLQILQPSTKGMIPQAIATCDPERQCPPQPLLPARRNHALRNRISETPLLVNTREKTSSGRSSIREVEFACLSGNQSILGIPQRACSTRGSMSPYSVRWPNLNNSAHAVCRPFDSVGINRVTQIILGVRARMSIWDPERDIVCP